MALNGQTEWKPDPEECREVLEKIVRVNTCQPEGNEASLVDVIMDMLPENTACTRIGHTPGRASLIVKVEGESQDGGIAFIGHLDTVACSDLDQWAYPPHQAVVKDGILYGRGSSDMKGGDAAMILTIRSLASSGVKLKKPVYFCFTADEESTGMGIRAVAEGHYLDSVEEIVICEPSGEQIGICEKGALWLDVVVHGMASHASRPDLGANAVEYAMEFSSRLKDYIMGGTGHPILGATTVSVTNFHGGIMTNIIPSGAEMELDIRTVPGVSHDDLITAAQEICGSIMKEHPSVRLEITVLNNRPALETPPESPFVRRMMETAEKTGITAEPKGLFFYTDASQLIPVRPVPFVIAGPGDDALAHCVNEHIVLASVARYAELYGRYINEYYT